MPLRRRIAQRVAHCFTDACIAPAGHMVDEYARTMGLRCDRIDLIHNGIDVHRFSRERCRESRAALGLGTDSFVGRLDPVKDIQGVVEIFARFRRGLGLGGGKARLLIVGDGLEREKAEQSVAAHALWESVLFAGLRADIPECMAAMDVYLQPRVMKSEDI